MNTNKLDCVYVIIRTENIDGSYKIIRIFSDYFEAMKFFHILDVNYKNSFKSPYKILTLQVF